MRTFASAFKNGALTYGLVTSRSKELKQASLFTRLLGALDEWLSLRSAKPSTAVRIRHAPRKSSVHAEDFLFFYRAEPQRYAESKQLFGADL